MMSIRWPAVLLVAVLAVTGCADGTDRSSPGGTDRSPPGGADRSSPGVTIVATTSVLGDVVANVLGDVGEVHVLMPAGVDPHGYEPSAADAALVREADLVVANGLDLEVGLVDVLRAAEADGVPVLRVAEEVDPIPFAGAGHADEHEHAGEDPDDGEHGRDDHDEELDPHIWFDPVRMADATTLIGDRLLDVVPDATDGLRRNADGYRRELLALHERIAAILGEIPPDARGLVTNHDSLGYLAARYDLEVVGTVVPGGTTLGESSSKDLNALIGTIREADVPAIFVETTAPDRLARTISAELGGGVEVVELFTGSLGPEGSGADTYIGMLETDARRIADGLSR